MRSLSKLLSGLFAVAVLAPPASAQVRDRDRTQLRDPTTHAGDSDGFPDRDRDRAYLRLRDRIKLDARLDASQISALEPELWRYHARRGDHLRLRQFAREMVQSRCTGSCFQVALHNVNRAMDRGASAATGMAYYRDAFREQRREQARLKLGDGEHQARVQERFDQRMHGWEARREAQARMRERNAVRARELDRDRARDQDRDRMRDQDRDRTRDMDRDRIREHR